jgi:magnesium-transporting ATPase (P-type)
MAIGRAQRFEERKPRVVAVFGDNAETVRAVAQVLGLMEMAWHDCYAEVTPPEDVVDDVLLCSGGTLRGLIDAAHLAVVDRRDLSVRAAGLRGTTNAPHP